MYASASNHPHRFAESQVGFTPVRPDDFPMLWEWRHRPHVAPWWESWAPATYEASVKEWTAMVEGTVPQKGYLITVEGTPVGYMEGYRLSEAPEMPDLGLDRDAVGADVYIADEAYLYQGLGPLAVSLFYLRMMDETGLDAGIIDPEVRNRSAIRAYEKAGFTFLRELESQDPPSMEYYMLATRDSLEAALRARTQ